MEKDREQIKLSYIPRIISKIFQEGVYKENYTLENAKKALSGCVGAKVLTEILIEYESKIIEGLISQTKLTY